MIYIYILLIALCTLMMYFYEKIKKKPDFEFKNIYLWLLLFGTIMLISVVFGFRAVSVGTDTSHYKEIFYNTTSYKYCFEKGGLEPLYLIIGVFTYKTAHSFTVFQFVLGIIMSTLMLCGIIKISKNITLSTFLFFTTGCFFQSMNIVRQYMTLGFILFGLSYLIRNDKYDILKFCAFVLIGAGFHKSALIVFALIPFRFIKVNWWTMLSVVVLACASMLLLPYILKVVDAVLKTNYSIYHSAPDTSLLFKVTTMFICVFVVIVAVSFKNFVDTKSGEGKFNVSYNLYVWMILIYAVLKIVSNVYIENISRLATYFYIVLPLIIPEVTQCMNQKVRRFVIPTICVFSLIFVSYLIILHGSFGVYPYAFV